MSPLRPPSSGPVWRTRSATAPWCPTSSIPSSARSWTRSSAPARSRARGSDPVIKQTPSVGRMIAMVAFTASCVGILLFLWLAFGGSIPLRRESYRITVVVPEATTLVEEADVRLAGVNIGKVKKRSLDKGAARTRVELEIKSKYAPIPRDTKAILRQKTLLGEAFIELSPGNKKSGMLEDGGQL